MSLCDKNDLLNSQFALIAFSILIKAAATDKFQRRFFSLLVLGVMNILKALIYRGGRLHLVLYERRQHWTYLTDTINRCIRIENHDLLKDKYDLTCPKDCRETSWFLTNLQR